MDHYNIKKIFQKIDEVKDQGVLNVFLLKYSRKSIGNNRKINYPENAAIGIFHGVCEKVKKYACDVFEFQQLNPVEKVVDTCEWVKISEVEKQWNQITDIIKGDLVATNNIEANEILKSINFSLIDVDYAGINYKFCTVQSPCEKFFRGKKMYKNKNGKVSIEEMDGIFLLSEYVDFIVTEDDGSEYVYIINRDNFMSFFDYDNHLCEKVKTNLGKLKDTGLVSSFDFIESSMNKKYVYRALAKIIEDDEYLLQIKKTTSSDFKRRLIENCKEDFTEKDFDEHDKVILNSHNLKVFIKAISKQLKYNFFTGKVDE